MATNKKLNPDDIASLINAMKVVFPTLAEVSKLVDEKLDEKIKPLPTKDEFFTQMLELLGEVQSMREAQELHSGDHTRINDRLDTHDKHLGISTAP